MRHRLHGFEGVQPTITYIAMVPLSLFLFLSLGKMFRRNLQYRYTFYRMFRASSNAPNISVLWKIRFGAGFSIVYACIGNKEQKKICYIFLPKIDSIIEDIALIHQCINVLYVVCQQLRIVIVTYTRAIFVCTHNDIHTKRELENFRLLFISWVGRYACSNT